MDKNINYALSLLGIHPNSRAANIIKRLAASNSEAAVLQLEKEARQLEYISDITITDEMTPQQRELERLHLEARLRYYKEHRRWPEEDGVCISINI